MNLRWFRDKKSDEEFVGEIREQRRAIYKWRRWMGVIILSVNIPLLGWMVMDFENFIELMSMCFSLPVIGAVFIYLFGMTAGCYLGLFSGVYVDMLGILGQSRRRDELLLKLYDEAQEAGRQSNSTVP